MSKIYHSSVHGDWRTPQAIVKRVRKVFGGTIDLDPCTGPENPTGAGVAGTIEQDGLAHDWSSFRLLTGAPCHVYVNPPYGRAIGAWTEKAAREAQLPTTQIIMLLPARVDTKWWHELWPYVHLCTFVRGRIKFDPPPGYTGACGPAGFPSALLALYPPADWSPIAELGLTVRGGAIW